MSRNLTSHKAAKHEFKVNLCDQCNYVTDDRMKLKQHIKFKHEGHAFRCEQCKWTGTTKRDLTSHYNTRHLGKDIYFYQMRYFSYHSLPRHFKKMLRIKINFRFRISISFPRNYYFFPLLNLFFLVFFR